MLIRSLRSLNYNQIVNVLDIEAVSSQPACFNSSSARAAKDSSSLACFNSSPGRSSRRSPPREPERCCGRRRSREAAHQSFPLRSLLCGALRRRPNVSAALPLGVAANCFVFICRAIYWHCLLVTLLNVRLHLFAVFFILLCDVCHVVAVTAVSFARLSNPNWRKGRL